MPGPSTLLHGFFDVLEARSMCLKVVVVIFAACSVGRLVTKEDALRPWREEVGLRMRRGVAARMSIYCLSSMMKVV
jgi:hypothetical protein